MDGRDTPGHEAAKDTASEALPVPAIHRRHLEAGKLDAVDAADIERDHGRSVRLVAAGKYLDAAIAAGLMADTSVAQKVMMA